MALTLRHIDDFEAYNSNSRNKGSSKHPLLHCRWIVGFLNFPTTRIYIGSKMAKTDRIIPANPKTFMKALGRTIATMQEGTTLMITDSNLHCFTFVFTSDPMESRKPKPTPNAEVAIAKNEIIQVIT
jgi:hypothetical protein